MIRHAVKSFLNIETDINTRIVGIDFVIELVTRVEIQLKNRSRFERFERFSSKI